LRDNPCSSGPRCIAREYYAPCSGSLGFASAITSDVFAVVYSAHHCGADGNATTVIFGGCQLNRLSPASFSCTARAAGGEWGKGATRAPSEQTILAATARLIFLLHPSDRKPQCNHSMQGGRHHPHPASPQSPRQTDLLPADSAAPIVAEKQPLTPGAGPTWPSVLCDRRERWPARSLDQAYRAGRRE